MQAPLILRPEEVTQIDTLVADLPAWAASVLRYVSAAVRSGETVTIIGNEETLTPEQMAREIGMSRSGVQRRLAAGEIASRKVGNRYRIPRREVERFRAAYLTDLATELADDF